MKNMPIEVVNLENKFALFHDHWSPKIVGALNGQLVKLVKVKGEFVWHQHEKEDELFMVIKGVLTIQLGDKDLVIRPGEFAIIPRGVEHRPVAEEEVHILLFEPASTVNTGELEENDFTKKDLKEI